MPTGKCFYFQSATGETIEKNPIPIIIADKEIEPETFASILENLKSQGIMEFQIDNEHRRLTNYNDFYSISLKDGSSNSFRLVCGYHRDPRFEKIIDIFFENMSNE
jgi:hypothetical protein